VSQALELARREAAWRKAKRDPVWLAGDSWYIQHPEGSRLFAMRGPQREALQRWVDGENSITLKARQIGWSTLVGYYAFWLAFFEPEVKILILSKGEREATELLEKVSFGLDRLPKWLAARGPSVTQRTMSKIKFANGSEIQSLPSGNNPARGFTGRAVICDEFAFLENSEQAWASIEPVTDVGGQLIVLSTAAGVGNMFHDLWVRAQDRKSVFEPMFFGWQAVPERDDDWYAQKKFDLPEWQLHQEYPSSPHEAFIKSGRTVFDTETLGVYEAAACAPVWVGNLDGPGPELPNTFEAVPNGQGLVRAWEKPLDRTAYVIGADVAEGLGHGDFSSAHVVKVSTGELVATWHGHMSAELFAYELYKLGTWFNSALIMPEVNNHGLTTVTELRRLGYQHVWRRRQVNSITNKIGVEYGWKTTRVTKPLMIDDLSKFLREHVDETPVRCPQTVGELLTYVRNDRGQMGGSPHDDRVISLALAVQALSFAHQPEYQDKVEYAEWTLGWYEQELRVWEDEQKEEEAWVI
jgi:hypothetical protein